MNKPATESTGYSKSVKSTDRAVYVSVNVSKDPFFEGLIKGIVIAVVSGVILAAVAKKSPEETKKTANVPSGKSEEFSGLPLSPGPRAKSEPEAVEPSVSVPIEQYSYPLYSEAPATVSRIWRYKVSSPVRIRDRPGMSGSTTLTILLDGDSVEIDDRQSDWWRENGEGKRCLWVRINFANAASLGPDRWCNPAFLTFVGQEANDPVSEQLRKFGERVLNIEHANRANVVSLADPKTAIKFAHDTYHLERDVFHEAVPEQRAQSYVATLFDGPTKARSSAPTSMSTNVVSSQSVRRAPPVRRSYSAPDPVTAYCDSLMQYYLSQALAHLPPIPYREPCRYRTYYNAPAPIVYRSRRFSYPRSSATWSYTVYASYENDSISLDY